MMEMFVTAYRKHSDFLALRLSVLWATYFCCDLGLSLTHVAKADFKVCVAKDSFECMILLPPSEAGYRCVAPCWA